MRRVLASGMKERYALGTPLVRLNNFNPVHVLLFIFKKRLIKQIKYKYLSSLKYILKAPTSYFGMI